MKSEGNSPTGSEDYKLGESGCAKKRWLQQAISEQGIMNITSNSNLINDVNLIVVKKLLIISINLPRFGWN